MRFISNYAPELPFTLYGLEITTAPLASALLNPRNDRNEKLIRLALKDDGLTQYLRSYEEISGNKCKDTLYELLRFSWLNNLELLLACGVLLKPEEFYWGPQGYPMAYAERLKFIKDNPDILAIKTWSEMDGPEIVLPPEVIRIFNTEGYKNALSTLQMRLQQKTILFKKRLTTSYVGEWLQRG